MLSPFPFMYHTPLGQARNNLDQCAKQNLPGASVGKGRSSLPITCIANEKRDV